MGVIDDIVRLLKDDYKVGVENKSKTPVIYLNPNRVDLWLVERATKREDKELLAEQIARQVDEQYPGLSLKLTTDQLVFLLKESLTDGPFAREVKEELGVCIVNQPFSDTFKKDTVLHGLGISKNFRPEHLNALPGSNAVWRELIGMHEGEHCNQTGIKVLDPNAEIKVLEHETRADRTALETTEAAGHHDVAKAYKSIRAIAAANGDVNHATSIFLDQESFDGITAEHLSAAQNFRKEMLASAAAELGISTMEAESLRTDDPQKFAKIVGDAQLQGKIPVPVAMSVAEIRTRVATEMGLSDTALNALEQSKLGDITQTYNKLKANGEFIKDGDQNPHIQTYIRNYVDAVQFLCIPDTSPALKQEVKLETAVTTPEDTVPQEESDLPSEGDLMYEAERQQAWRMNEAVSESLGITEDDADELRLHSPVAYLEKLEDLLKADKVPLTTTHSVSDQKRNEIIAKTHGIEATALDEFKKNDQFIYDTAVGMLEQANAFTRTHDNPHMKKTIETYILETRKEIAAEVETPEVTKENEVQQKPETIEIDLHSGEHGAMKISGLSAPAYFALQATAKQQPSCPDNLPETSSNARANPARCQVATASPAA